MYRYVQYCMYFPTILAYDLHLKVKTVPANNTSNPTITTAKTKNNIFISIHTSNSLTQTWERGEKGINILPHKQTERQETVERAHTQTNKETQKTQSTAQPEVDFMQKYSKVCFTIQLNIKDSYIPL